MTSKIISVILCLAVILTGMLVPGAPPVKVALAQSPIGINVTPQQTTVGFNENFSVTIWIDDSLGQSYDGVGVRLVYNTSYVTATNITDAGTFDWVLPGGGYNNTWNATHGLIKYDAANMGGNLSTSNPVCTVNFTSSSNTGISGLDFIYIPADAATSIALEGADILNWTCVVNGTVTVVPAQYNLTINSTAGGNVTTPGEGTSTYNASEVVALVAAPDATYTFVNWTGDVGTIDDASSATTNITMNGNYTITANFAAMLPIGVNVTPQQTTVGFNENFNVTIWIDDPLAQSYDGVGVRLVYNTSYVTATNVTDAGTFDFMLDSGTINNTWNATHGLIKYDAANTGGALNVSNPVCTVNFTSNSSNTGISGLDFIYIPADNATSITLAGADILNWTCVVNGTVTVVPAQYNLTINSTAGGNVTTPGEGTFGPYANGTVVDLVAAPDANYSFVNWTGDVTTIANVNSTTTNITMNGNYNITANFAPVVPAQYNLTINSTAGGNVTTPGEGTFGSYANGTVVDLVAAPDTNYTFVNWTGDMGTIDDASSATTNITMNGNYTITANFAAMLPIGVNVTPQQTTVGFNENFNVTIWIDDSLGQSYDGVGVRLVYNTSYVTATNVTDAGTFDWVLDSGTINNTWNATHGLVKYDAANLTGNLSASNPVCTVNFTSNSNAGISGLDFIYIPADAATSITLQGADILNWTCVVNGTVTVGMPSLTVNVTPSGAGNVTVNGVTPPSYPNTTTWSFGDNVTLNATAAGGYSFINWSGDLSGNTTPVNITMDSDKNVTAHFSMIGPTYNLTVTSNGCCPINVTGAVSGTVPAGGNLTFTGIVEGENVTVSADDSGVCCGFVNWSDAGTQTHNITMDSDKSVTAYCSVPTYNLTVNVTPSVGGNVTVNGATPPSYPNTTTWTCGVNVTLNATAAGNYSFNYWSGDLSGSTNPTNITMNGNYTITANFAAMLPIGLNVTPQQTTVGFNENFNVTIWIDDSLAQSYDGVGVRLVYNTSYVTATNVTDAGTFDWVLDSGTINNTWNATHGLVKYDAANLGGALNVSKPVCTVNFTSNSNAGISGLDFIYIPADAATSITLAGADILNWTCVVNGTVTVVPGEYNLTINSTAGGNVTTPGEGTFGPYANGTVVDLAAAPDTNYTFVNWTGDVTTIDAPNSATTNITMNGNYSITANFAPVVPGEYNLTINSTAGGNVTTPGEGTFTYNASDVVDLAAAPDTNYTFVNWTGDVGTIDDANSATTNITMNGNYSITANFAAMLPIGVNVTPQHTTVGFNENFNVTIWIDDSLGQSYDGVGVRLVYNTSYVTATNVTDAGTFDWVLDSGTINNTWNATHGLVKYDAANLTGNLSASNPVCTVNFTSNSNAGISGLDFIYIPADAATGITLEGADILNWTYVVNGTVTVVPAQYNLTINSTAGGNVTTPGEGTFTYNASEVVALVAAADANYSFVNWTGDVTTIANINSTTTNITMNADYNITANFAPVVPGEYNLTINSTVGGNVTTPGEGTFTYNASDVVDLAAAPDTNYTFVNWTGDVGTIDDANSATTNITMNGNYSITANFAAMLPIGVNVTPQHTTVGFNENFNVTIWIDDSLGQSYDGVGVRLVYNTSYVTATNVTDAGTFDWVLDSGTINNTWNATHGLVKYDAANLTGNLSASNPVCTVNFTSNSNAGISGLDFIYIPADAATGITLEGADILNWTYVVNGTVTVVPAQYNLTINSTAGGNVTTPGEGTFTYNASEVVALVAAADANYSFVNWTGDVTTIANVNSTTTNITMNADYNITANFAPGEYNLTINSTAGGNVTTPGEGTFGPYANSTVVDLVAAADANYSFVNWTGDVTTIANVNSTTTNITMNGNYTITANFAPGEYNLTINSTDGGNVTTPGEGTFGPYANGTVVDLVATPDASYVFVNWTGDVTTIANVNSTTTNITMNGNYTITANFAVTVTYNLTVTSDGCCPINVTGAVNGTVPADGNQTFTGISEGANVTVSADDSGVCCGFVNWSDAGAQTHNITMDSDKSVTAYCSVPTYNLTVNVTPGGGGNVTVNGTAPPSYPNTTTWYCGDNVTLNATAAGGYSFVNWTGNLTGNTTPTNITMDSAKNVTANFIRAYNLTVTSDGCCPINVTGAVNGTVPAGGNQTFTGISEGENVTVSADDSGVCCGFVNWSDAGAQTHNITMDSDKSVTAYCSVPTYNLTVNVTPGGGGNVTVNGTAPPSYPNTTTWNCGDTVTLNATAAGGYSFVNWTGNLTGNTTPTNITMDSAKNVTANFIRTYNLTVTSDGCCPINVTGAVNGTVPAGGNQTFTGISEGENVTVSADDSGVCCGFVNWSDAGAQTHNITMDSDKSVTAYCSVPTYNLTVNVTPGGGGNVTLNGTTPPSYPNTTTWTCGANVTLNATAATGYNFSHWGGDLSGNTTPVNITMNSAKNVTAYFGLIGVTHNLTVNVTPSGGGDVEVNGVAPGSYPYNYTFDDGDLVDLNAVPAGGYSFVNWTGDLSGSTNPTNKTMYGNYTITANFIRAYNLTVTSDGCCPINVTGAVNGTVSAGGSETFTGISEGENVTVSADDSGVCCGFVNWSDAGAQTHNITMDSDKSVTAYCSVPTYNLTVNVTPGGGGNVTVNGTAPPSYPNTTTWYCGDNVTLNATAAGGYSFVNWSGDLSGNTTPVNITMNGNYTITANFEAVPDISVDPTTKNFGSITVGSSSSPQTFNVSNVGNANLSVGTINITGTNDDQFAIQNDNVSSETIIPGGSATLQVVFSPTSKGAKSAALNIPSDDPDEPTKLVSLSGIGKTTGGGGGGGGGGAAYYLTVNMSGDISKWKISKQGNLLELLQVSSADNKVTISLDKGASCLGKSDYRLSTITISNQTDWPSVPEDYDIIGRAYEFQPAGAKFAPALSLTLSYDDNDVPQYLSEEDVYIAYYDATAEDWVPLTSQVDTENNIVTAPVSHLTTFAIMRAAVPPPANFSITSLDLSSEQVKPGQEVLVTVNVTNIGGSEGSYTLNLTINGAVEQTKTVTLAPLASDTVTFTVIKEEPGSYTISVDGLTKEFSVAAVAPSWISRYWWVILEILVVVGILLFFLLWWRPRRAIRS